MKGRIVAAIYIDPDFYPPTINGILNMAGSSDEVQVITRNHSKADFPYPANVRLKKLGRLMPVRETEKLGFVRKTLTFLHFTWSVLTACLKPGTKWLVLYDAIPLFSFYLIRLLLPSRVRIWYHNHDMPSISSMRKYSIGWFSARYEFAAMKHINVFTLPSVDRLEYYPLRKESLPYYTIPNYPSTKVYTPVGTKNFEGRDIRVIYQGFIGPGHALEEMISLMRHPVAGRNCQLVLKGSVTEEYKRKLESFAAECGVSDRIAWVGIGPYAELRPLTASCDIGIGIHMNTDNVSKTLGTASNKIYEYAACGLPVILYNTEQFKRYLSEYKWTFFSDGTEATLKQALEVIIPQLPDLSKQARKDFEENLNFEKAFGPFWHFIENN